MKNLLLIIFMLWAGVLSAQTVGQIRYDTTKILKVGGYNELKVQNNTKDSTGGLFVNTGNGWGRWLRAKAVPGGIVLGIDTVFITSNDWHLTGNSGTSAGTNFLGTTDAQSLIFKAGDTLFGKLQPITHNVALGFKAFETATGSDNISIGTFAHATGTGDDNIAIGRLTLETISGLSDASRNVIIGALAGQFYQNQDETVGIGYSALASASLNTSIHNTAVGAYSLAASQGHNNTAVGFKAGINLTTGIDCVVIGDSAVVTGGSAQNSVVIGSHTVGQGQAFTIDPLVRKFSMIGTRRNAYDVLKDSSGFYVGRPAIVLTTTGSSGASTWDNSTGTLNIPSYSGGSGGGLNFYNSDSTLSGDRTVNGGSHDLLFDSLNNFTARIGGEFRVEDLNGNPLQRNSTTEFSIYKISGGNLFQTIGHDEFGATTFYNNDGTTQDTGLVIGNTGMLRAKRYANNVGEDSVLSTDVDGNLKMKLAGGSAPTTVYTGDGRTGGGNRIVSASGGVITFDSASIFITGSDNGNTPLSINGHSGQTANVLDINTGNGSGMSFLANGDFALPNASIAQDGTFTLPNASISAAGDLTANNILGNTYTPTLTNTTNITSSTAHNCQYTRVGNIVTVFGSVDVTTTLAVSSVLNISLPIASNLGVSTHLNGTANASTAIATNGVVLGDDTADEAALNFIGLSIGGAGTIFFSFSYEIL